MEHAVRDEIVRFVDASPENRHREGEERYFDEPLVGFASATDPLFTEYKRIIGPFHRTPPEWMAMEPDAQDMRQGTVICWILPVTRGTRASNRREHAWPSREWAHTRNYGEKFNNLLRLHLVAFLSGRGHRAIAPATFPGLEADRRRPHGDRLHMVGAPRRLCRGSWDLQPQRRPDHPTGNRPPLRERDHRSGPSAHETVRHGSLGGIACITGRGVAEYASTGARRERSPGKGTTSRSAANTCTGISPARWGSASRCPKSAAASARQWSPARG